MDNIPKDFYKGTARIGENPLDLEIHYASKFTVFVKFPSDRIIENNTILEDLTLVIDGMDHKISRCKYILDFQSDDFDGVLIFLDDIYDLDYLFYNREVINLDRMTSDLELVMDKKNEIRQSFKDYTSDLSFDLEVFRNFFDDFDSKIAREDPYFQDKIRDTLIRIEGRKFVDFFLEKLHELEEMVENFNKVEHTKHGFYFRKQMMNFILCSNFMKRTNIKPRGYAGDSRMMYMIYQNAYEGETTFSKVLHKISVEHPAAQAVRNRRAIIAERLKKKMESVPDGQVLEVLSVACGPACELEDLLRSKEDVLKIRLTLLDQDKSALEEARTTIFQIEQEIGLKIKVTYLEDSIRTIMRDAKWAQRIGKFDFIYSMGLFDYLTTLVGKVLMTKLYSLLNPGAKLLIGNFHYQNLSRRFLEYWHDWVLFYRNEEEMVGLLDKTDAEDLSVFFEDTQCQMFLEARKGDGP